MKELRSLMRRLASDQRGSVAVSFVMVFTLMVGSTVFAIDMARYNIAQSRLQSALDLALISVGRNLPQYQVDMDGPEGDVLRRDVHDYFYANIPASFLGASLPAENITINVRPGTAGDLYPDAQYIELGATGKLPMLSTGFFDFSAMDLRAGNTAIRRIRSNLEMVLALDNSSTVDVGTQRVEVTATDNKLMDTLMSESKKLADTVLSAAATSSGVAVGDDSGAYIGLVPFTDFVNVRDIGPVEGWLRTRPQQEALIKGVKRPNGTWTTPVWQGCISEPLPSGGLWSGEPSLPARVLSPEKNFQPIFTIFGHSHDIKELDHKNPDGFLVKSRASPHEAPSPDMDDFFGPDFDQHDWSDDQHPPRTVMVWPYEKSWTYRLGAAPHAHAEPRHLWLSFATDSTYLSGMSGSVKIGSCLHSRVKFLTYDQTALNTAIDSMKKVVPIKIKGVDVDVYGYGGGSTIPVGLLWSWRMLSPGWRGADAWGSNTLPRDPGNGLRKIIVLFANRGNYPLYKHASDGNIKQPLKLGYDYKASPSANAKTIKVAPINLDIDLTSGPYAFTQCPLNGLRGQDPEDITPLNYNSGAQTPECPFDSTNIGYGGESSGSGLTTETVNAYMADICDSIKADLAGIEIFTVTLGESYSPDTKPLIQACASSPEKYFHAGNVDDLSQAFKTIAGAVTDFRLIR